MSVHHLPRVAAAVIGLSATAACANITIPTAPVGNAGNAANTTPFGALGAVNYTYNVGTTEVTNAQYAAFLNSVAWSDPNNLYNTNMAGPTGGITRTGSIGAFVYGTVSARANHPVNFVSFWDAARFANWLHNGQPIGSQDNSTTESGAYTLTPGAIAANSVTRNSNWQWAIASSNEWHKAAYHQPAAQGGDTDNYWLYPTSSNSAPTAGQANYLPSAIGDSVPVASYNANFYGCFDMAGNVYEWTDTPLAFVRGPLLGGAFDNVAGWLTPLNAYAPPPAEEREQLGFRVVAIPAPSSVALLAIGGLMVGHRRRVAR
jgi:sulfatase modifying factor 1